jgi:DNA recombination protein RmuC
VLASARRFDELGVAADPVPEPEPVEATVRALRPAGPVPPSGDPGAPPLPLARPERDGTGG